MAHTPRMYLLECLDRIFDNRGIESCDLMQHQALLN
jgi:hypothetical protein